jgi:hypothetical protein
LAYFGIIRNPIIINGLSYFIDVPGLTPGCLLKSFSDCYIIKLKLYDDEYQVINKSILATNIVMKKCEISGNACDIEDSSEKWQLSGEVYEGKKDSIVLKLNKAISEFEDESMQLVFISDSRTIKQLTGYAYNYQNGHIGDVKMNICNSIGTPAISEDKDVTDYSDDTEITRYYVQLVCSKYSNIQKEVLSKAGLTDNYECRIVFNPSANCYKYIIGSFDSIEEADNFRNQEVTHFYGKPVLVKEIITSSDSVFEIIEER